MKPLKNITFSLCLIIHLQCLQAQQPSGYVGCYKIEALEEVTGKLKKPLNNGSYCIQFCKNVTKRYASTQDQYCRCGTNIRNNSDSEKPYCDYKCPGQSSEVCGGKDSISVYDIESVNGEMETLTQSLPSSAKRNLAIVTTPQTSVLSTDQVNQETDIQLTPNTSLMINISTADVNQQKGRTTDVPAFIYVLVPVSIIVVIVVTVSIVNFRNRKLRSIATADKYVCFHRKRAVDDCHIIQLSENKAYGSDSDKRSEIMQKSSNNLYAEISFANAQPVEQKAENENLITSCPPVVSMSAGHPDRSVEAYDHMNVQPSSNFKTSSRYLHINQFVPLPEFSVSDRNDRCRYAENASGPGIYDTCVMETYNRLQYKWGTNVAGTVDCFNAYDHVRASDQNKQLNDKNE